MYVVHVHSHSMHIKRNFCKHQWDRKMQLLDVQIISLTPFLPPSSPPPLLPPSLSPSLYTCISSSSFLPPVLPSLSPSLPPFPPFLHSLPFSRDNVHLKRDLELLKEKHTRQQRVLNKVCCVHCRLSIVVYRCLLCIIVYCCLLLFTVGGLLLFTVVLSYVSCTH